MIGAPPDDDGDHPYTVLFRTASAAGGNGVNVQETITLSDDDRKAIVEIVDDITNTVNVGLKRCTRPGTWASPPTSRRGAPSRARHRPPS